MTDDNTTIEPEITLENPNGYILSNSERQNIIDELLLHLQQTNADIIINKKIIESGGVQKAKELVNNNLTTQIDGNAKNILADFDFGSVDYVGAVKAGDLTWNQSTGAITGGSGVAVYRGGIVGAKNGVSKFAITTSGDASFAGQLNAATGTFTGQLHAGTVTSSTINGTNINGGTIEGATFKANNGTGSDVWISNTGEVSFRKGGAEIAFMWVQVTDGSMHLHSIETLYLTADKNIHLESNRNMFIVGDNIYFAYNDDDSGADCYWISDGVITMKLTSNGNLIVVGDVSVYGNLSKGSGSFRIDHPLKPYTHELYHSFVESPEMLNIYKGRSKTIKGKCTIELPEYFEALNENFEYNLTPIKELTTIAVKKEIKDNKFEVMSEKDCEFSWVVYGVRKDKFAKANPIIVEVEKEEKGYIHKELFE